jgi:uncharacterized protein (TIGR03083 family)
MPAISDENVVDLVVAEIQTMADLCRGADPATPVPTCPEWDLAELQRHTGSVHRWAATMVERSSQERLGREDMTWDVPEDPVALADWLADGAAFVAARFRPADPETPMWAWGWPKTAGFWPRRMLHETGIHRADAELALGRDPTFHAEVAADGIGELLDNLPHAAYFAPGVAELRGAGETLGFVADDLGERWEITLQPNGFSWTRSTRAGSDTDATVAGAASWLLLVLYRRAPIPDDAITGDRGLVELWLANSSL